MSVPAAAGAARHRRRHVLDLDDFSAQEIDEILETAVSMKEVLGRAIKQVPTLRGKTIVNMFFEESTRTRISFELAGKALSANVVNFTARGSSVEKGESLIDTVRTLQALGADMLVMRHSESGAPYLVAQHFHGSVINAGDGRHAHPTQALLDLFTVRQRLGRIEGLKVVIVGDILHSRVARSDLWGFTRMGALVTLCAPQTLIGPEAFWKATWPDLTITSNLDECVRDADVIMTLRLQKERMEAGLLPSLREYTRFFAITAERVARAAPHCLVMHPGPMNEGVEIMPDVAVSAQSVIEEQVANGVAVRMALLYRLSGE
ncbi:aspartate carbamoyltransferase catalytic subunit [Roseiflexus castenholzii]|uniref:Aspartate carbamoyltransferase catalytic subunit n=1 Tax=Roseiflexus castenholzii (strain DSM 13941 / HLO8) TaxID=383372 RepID=PYRB_ROSCS|nr:aspartate carbamoyltransferase catalytic subunit [Roseiflexus castenholzii]A7NLW6.1 RecName: Full=Aspartate carbamoyltransferase catalytic subunit; AltName: Full=Aspartate transcarbamylase; Short=ATCase [Roseiflexus castenholzii DSM 13941]ABU58514.1 aspartate carbamoyltransferase [Roseiflexus castenholzii DSM 13941]